LEKPLIQLNLTEFEVSAENQTGLAPLKKGIFDSLNIVRVYTKDPSKKEPDLEHPLTLTYGSEVIHLAGMVHQELANQFHSARIWGKNKHDGTIVNSHYILQDRDVVEIKTR
jgi:ribosome-interacting GTPase 1